MLLDVIVLCGMELLITFLGVLVMKMEDNLYREVPHKYQFQSRYNLANNKCLLFLIKDKL